MTRLLADTSYLAAHFNVDDVHHRDSLAVQDRFMAGEWEHIVLLDCVFMELIPVLMRRMSYSYAKQVGEVLRNGEEIQWVESSEMIEAAWHEFLAQPKDSLSLVDSMLLAAADRLGLKQIATFDRGFDSVTAIERVPRT